MTVLDAGVTPSGSNRAGPPGVTGAPDPIGVAGSARATPTGAPGAEAGAAGRSRHEAIVVRATTVISLLNYAYTMALVWLLPVQQYAIVGSISALLLICGTVAGASSPWVLAREVATARHDADRRRRAVSFCLLTSLAQALVAATATCAVAHHYAAGAGPDRHLRLGGDHLHRRHHRRLHAGPRAVPPHRRAADGRGRGQDRRRREPGRARASGPAAPSPGSPWGRAVVAAGGLWAMRHDLHWEGALAAQSPPVARHARASWPSRPAPPCWPASTWCWPAC